MNSFIPKITPKVAIIDGRVSDEIVNNLEKLGLSVIKTISCNDVDISISYHPDIVLHPVDSGVVVAPNVFEYYNEKLSKLGIKVYKGESILDCKYPKDIPYNIGRIGNDMIHNLKFTDKVIFNLLEDQGAEFINIKQGYTKCSLGNIGETMGITADIPIYKILKKRGYEILLINSGEIELPGQDYGFIGGCMGNLDEETVLFSGEIKHHSNYNDIDKFLKENGKKYISLSNEKLLDVGSIMVL